MATLTSRSLIYLRRLGYQAELVEKQVFMAEVARRRNQEWNGPPMIRQDLWTFGDIIACHPKLREILIVQATDTTSVAKHVAKAKDRRELAVWLASGGKFEIWGWRRPAEEGGRWTVRRLAIVGAELTTVLTTPRKRGQRQKQRGLFDGGDA